MLLAHLLLALPAPVAPWTGSLPPLPACWQEAPPRPSLDASCRIAFDALAGDRFELLEATFPTVAEMQALFDADRASASAERRADALEQLRQRGGIEALRADALAKLRERYERTRREVLEHFEWSEAAYIGALPLAQPPRPIAGTELEVAPVEFLVAARGEVWSFGANDVLRGPRGWAFTELVAFRGRRSLVDPSARDRELDARRIAELEEELSNERRAYRVLLESQAQPQVGPTTQMQLEESRAEAALLRERLEAMHHEIAAQGEQFSLAMSELRARQDEVEANLELARGEQQARATELEYQQQLHRETVEQHELEGQLLDMELLRAQIQGDALRSAVERLQARLQAAGDPRDGDTGSAAQEGAREALAELDFPASELPRASLAFLLRAIQHDLRDHARVRWVRTEKGLELTLE